MRNPPTSLPSLSHTEIGESGRISGSSFFGRRPPAKAALQIRLKVSRSEGSYGLTLILLPFWPATIKTQRRPQPAHPQPQTAKPPRRFRAPTAAAFLPRRTPIPPPIRRPGGEIFEPVPKPRNTALEDRAPQRCWMNKR